MAEPRPSWAPPDIDLSTATLARIYDYLLGGAHNFAVDREIADRMERAVPGIAKAAWANRAFLQRAVRYCANQGIDQFLDVGSGIPTEGNVHEVVRDVLPDARVVYVDVDPIAVIHSSTLLAGDPRCAVVHADLRSPERILDDPATQKLIAFDRPVAVLLVSLLHVIPDDDDPAELISRLTARTVAGSHLVISHFARNCGTDEQVGTLIELTRNTSTPIMAREPDEILALLGAFAPVPPGLVPVHEWRRDPDTSSGADHSAGYAVVGRKP